MARVADVRRLGGDHQGQSQGRISRGPLSKSTQGLSLVLNRPDLKKSRGSAAQENHAPPWVQRANSDSTLAPSAAIGPKSRPGSKQGRDGGSGMAAGRAGQLFSSNSFGPSLKFANPTDQSTAARSLQVHQQKYGSRPEMQWPPNTRPPDGRNISGSQYGTVLQSTDPHEPEDLFAVLEQRIQAQRDELRQHRETIQHTIEQDVQELSVQCHQDRVELNDVYSKYREALDELARLRGLLTETNLELEAAQGTVQDMAAEADRFRDEVAVERSQQQEMLSEVQTQLAEALAKEDRQEALEQQIASLDQALATAREESATKIATEIELQTLQERNVATEQARQAAEAAKAKAFEELERRTQELEQSRAEVESRLRQQEEEAATLRNVSDQALKDLEVERNQVEIERTQFRAAAELQQQAMSASEQMNQDLANEILALEGERGSLRQELEHRENALQLAMEHIQTAEAESAAAKESERSLQQKLCSLEHEVRAAKEEIALLRTEVARLEEAGHELQTQISLMNEQTASIKQETKRSVTRTEETKNLGKSVTKEKNVVTNQVPEEGAVAKGVGVLINYSTKETEKTLQITVKEKEKIIQQITTELKTAKAELSDTRSFWKATQADVSNAQNQLRTEQMKWNKEREQLKSATTSAKQDLEQAQKQNRSAQSELSVLRTKSEEQQRNLTALGDQKRKLDSEIERLQAQESRLQSVSEERAELLKSAETESRLLKDQFEDEREKWGREQHVQKAEHQALQRASAEQLSTARKAREVLEERLAKREEDLRATKKMLELEKSAAAQKALDFTAQLKQQMERVDEEVESKAKAEVAKRHREMDTKERHFRTTVSKLLSAEEALESSLTCMHCLGIMQSPVTCSPCGHSFCSRCINPNECHECGPGVAVTSTVPSEALDALCGKYNHRVHQLKTLQKVLVSPCSAA